ncbi:MAG: hypothetical protein H0V44_16280 [Planctomycetes bacterium]|nr:hypothetical protein [Planctomycetota bacterium]
MGYHVRITGQCNRATIHEARKLFESQLHLSLKQDESDSWGGVHYTYNSNQLTVMLIKNRDLTDDALFEEFPVGAVLLSMSFLDKKEHDRLKAAINNCDLTGTVVEDISD